MEASPSIDREVIFLGFSQFHKPPSQKQTQIQEWTPNKGCPTLMGTVS